jgi:hypothetical protein
MKPEQLYQNLEELTEKLGITLSEQNLRISGLKVKSGLCTVKGEKMFIMDKHKNTRDKIEILASCLSKMPIEDIYIVPAIRELLDKHSK